MTTRDIEEREDNIEHELAEYRAERERMKKVFAQVGGKRESLLTRLINWALVVGIVALAVIEFVFKLIPAILALEIGVLLVSLKIIWMMHLQDRAFHFQFWVLNSLEYRLNDVAKRVRSMEKRLPGTGE